MRFADGTGRRAGYDDARAVGPGLAFGVAALLAAACGGGDAGASLVERVDSAGVEIVVNRGEDSPLAWSFDPVYTVGGSDEDADVVARIRTTGVDVDVHGRLYVLDAVNNHVAVFDGEGGLIRTVGREGGGPGEFARPVSLTVDGAEVMVLDARHPGLVRFDTAGHPLEPLRLEKPNLRWGVATFGGGVAFHWFDFRMREPTSRQRLTVFAGGEYTDVAELPGPTPAPVRFERCGVSIPTGPIFAPGVVWHGDAGRLAVTTGLAYAVDVHEDGRRVRSVRRDLPVREVTRADALAVYEDGLTITIGGRTCTVPAEEVVEAQGFRPQLQTVARIRLSASGEMWVQRRTLEYEHGPIDVFAPDGVYLGTLPAGTPYPETFLGEHRIAAIETDEFDVNRVVVYRVQRS